ncbi:MAG: type I-C CRISPR-associated protein Cas8c/Csd1 [Prevotella sp.]|nr:type I-C CRISPR-associated protein Cas8c/Csd1 [Prevotella sp.]
MIQELVALGKSLPAKKRDVSQDGSLKKEPVAQCLSLDTDGSFIEYIPYGKELDAEIITDSKGFIKAKQGSARFLLDKCEEVLGITIDYTKHESFRNMLKPYEKINAFAPVIRFYEGNGFKDAIKAFLVSGNNYAGKKFTFAVGTSLLLNNDDIQKAINAHIEQEMQRLEKKKNEGVWSLKNISYEIVIIISEEGNFKEFKICDEQSVLTESISVKKTDTFLCVGTANEIFGIIDRRKDKKHLNFKKKLEEYRADIPLLKPVYAFYEDKDGNGLTKAISESVNSFQKESKNKTYNLTFMVGTKILLNDKKVKSVISKRFKDKEKELAKNQTRCCSICGKSDSPILAETHGFVSMPKGQSAGSTLVSYNKPAFLSYGLEGNLNSSICRNCAREYREGLNFLMTDGQEEPDKNNKKEKHYRYNHRINISDSTVALFWASEEMKDFDPSSLENPPDSSKIQSMFNSVWKGKKAAVATTDEKMFYSCTMSSAAARIAVRDWTAISLEKYKQNLVSWFQDILIEDYNGSPTYTPLRALVGATQKAPKPGEVSKDDNDSKKRVGALLWYAAIKGPSYDIPIEVLHSVLCRIWKGDKLSASRAAIIKLIINRKTNVDMKSTLDEANASVAYLCGRLFADIESMQRMAIGKVNSGVKERFFTAAALQPAYIFGILLTKNVPVYERKVDKETKNKLEEIANKISENHGCIPQHFTPIEQGVFALGYYFQKNRNIKDSQQKKQNNKQQI